MHNQAIITRNRKRKYVTSGTKCETWRFLTNRHEVLH